MTGRTPSLYRIISILFLSLALAGGGQARAAGAADQAPAQVIADLQKAIDARDAQKVEQCVDLSATISKAVDDSSRLLGPAIASGQVRLNPVLSLALGGLGSLDQASVAAVKSLMVAETRKFVIYGVESGSFAGKPQKDYSKDGGLFLSFGNLSTDRKEFGPARLLSLKGDRAEVATSLRDYGNGHNYPLTLLLARSGDRWRVVSVENTEELTKLLIDESQKRQR